MEFDDNLIEEFVAEGLEHLQTVEGVLLQAEETKSAQDAQDVNQLFRAIHSIKGSAACLGFSKITGLTHVMETLLSLLRDGKISADQRLISSLLDGVDLLQRMFDDIGACDNIDIEQVVQNLQSILDSADIQDTQSMEEMNHQIAVNKLSGLKTGLVVDEYSLRHFPRSGSNLYLIQLELVSLGCLKDTDVLELNKQLESCGTIVASAMDSPEQSQAAGLDHAVYYEVIYSSVIDREMVAQLCGVDAAVIYSLSYEQLIASIDGEAKLECTKEKTYPDAMSVEEAFTSVCADVIPDKGGKVPAASVAGTQISAGGATIRLRVDLLDRVMSLAGEMVLARNQLLSGFSRLDHAMQSAVQRMDVITSEMQETIMRTRMQPAGNIFSKLPRIVRDISMKLDKQISLEIKGGEVELDKTILESLTDPLTHIIRNSCDHGIETVAERKKIGKAICGHIVVEATHQNGQVVIRVVDDGKGIDTARIAAKVIEKGLASEPEVAKMTEGEIVNLVMLPGFSTAEKVSDISGRGVGMDVVRSSIEKIGGVLELTSHKGEGTLIEMRLPLTLAIIPSLIVSSGGDRFAVPQVNIEEIICVYDWDEARKRVGWAGGREVYHLRGHLLPLLRMSDVMNNSQPLSEQKIEEISSYWRRNWNLPQDQAVKPIHQGLVRRALIFAVLRCGSGRFGLVFDDVQGSEEIVVKPMNPLLSSLRCFAGATVLGDGGIALILDVEGIFRHGRVGSFCSDVDDNSVLANVDKQKAEVQPVLFFRCGEHERFALPVSMIRRIERIKISDIERIGSREFITIGDQSTLVLRPDHYLQVSSMVEDERMLLILPRHLPHPAGILVHSIIDNRDVVMDVDQSMVRDEGAWGSLIVDGRMAILLDVLRMVELAMPDWFNINRGKLTNSGGCRILIAEDTPFFRNLVKSYLQAEGHEVEVCVNGEEALDQLRSEAFDLLVSDIEMPVMNGWELIRSLRRDENLRGLLAVALTSRDSSEDRAKSLECGFDRFESKINRESLLRTINELLSARSVMAAV